MIEHAQEVSLGERFEFGANWTRFLALVNEDRIRLAEHSLRDLLEAETLQGESFLDIGSGSKVCSFDYDPQSVACTRELKRRYFPDDPEWTVEQGSVLDQAFLVGLGSSDVVYSWAVLHHTRAMWQALENVTPLVKPQGRLRQEGSGRGMSPWQDVVDWVGGHPFEVAKPETIFDFYRHRDFVLSRLKTCAGGHGCNEFVFARNYD